MKEQIEVILTRLGIVGYNTNFGILTDEQMKPIVAEYTKEILALIPTNNWLEYPKNKPSENGWFNVAIPDNSVSDINKIIYQTYYWEDYFEETKEWDKEDVIAFKPIPVEPFVKKNKNQQVIDNLNTIINTAEFKDEHDSLFLEELKWHFENGDLK